MNIAIVCSKSDEASKNIHSFLVGMIKPRMGEHEVSLHLMDEESVFLEGIDKKLGCDFVIFATKHQSKSGVHSLSVHIQGNWGEAGMGGKNRELGIAPAGWLKEGLKLLEKKAASMHYEAIQECTHHGPYLEVPSMFVEIGSSIEEWNNKEAGRVIAETIIELLEMKIPNYKTAVGIGGIHHTPNFKKIMLESNIAVGHVCPKYNLQNLDKKMIQQALEKTVPKANLVIVDWKGVGEYKEKIKEMLEEIGVKFKKTKSKDFES
ncbi:MAG: D-aminoacyl-tRNA deacylase [Nanoarchaeota archaeon]|nr:D-aminoacyl-tRNA deacylase [Nanoarchaeota archaeon]MBU1270550.1 D-aminoacyl-tRNA deacylase [Nanoarchaeota archaeon]MBU1605018.1 D-aminoacyl-tRNA deacylase [Nanoarchaeota archaeon]MBU2443442.1 D-aminoacyl-tRNA deacylase [Nanoarchaeota archaeon]